MRTFSQVSKLKTFIYIFDSLSDQEGNLNQALFVEELQHTNQFTNDEIRKYTEKSIEYGQIFELKPGVLCRA